jgi:hypothetical protein
MLHNNWHEKARETDEQCLQIFSAQSYLLSQRCCPPSHLRLSSVLPLTCYLQLPNSADEEVKRDFKSRQAYLAKRWTWRNGSDNTRDNGLGITKDTLKDNCITRFEDRYSTVNRLQIPLQQTSRFSSLPAIIPALPRALYGSFKSASHQSTTLWEMGNQYTMYNIQGTHRGHLS